MLGQKHNPHDCIPSSTAHASGDKLRLVEPWLILFDVDGTLLVTGGATSRCLLEAARRCFEANFQWHPVTVGLLDQQLVNELALANGITLSHNDHRRFQACYLQILNEELQAKKQDVRVLPGVREMLDELRHRPDVTCGLLTGNLRAAAEAKLAAAEIDYSSFAVRAFADDANCRGELVKVAMDRAASIRGQQFRSDHIVIIGDTPRDMACARENQCISVGVATGQYTKEDLSAAGAHYVLSSLADRHSATLPWSTSDAGRNVFTARSTDRPR